MTPPPPACAEPSLRPGAEPGDLCGAPVAAGGRCLAHLPNDNLAAYLDGLAPGATIDARNVVFTAALLDQLLDSVTDDGSPRFGKADFGGAALTQDANFDMAIFTQDANFSKATFSGRADFFGATFSGHADFDRATFTQNAHFGGVTFTQDAHFDRAAFTQDARFSKAAFSQNANFNEATFSKGLFEGSRLLGDAVFRCVADRLVFDRAEVQVELVVEGAVGELSFVRLRSHGRVVLRLRGTAVDAGYAVCAGPLSVHGMAQPFEGISETHLSRPDGGVRMVSLRGADVERLVLTDVDLSACRFAGIHRLDEIVLDGRCVFAWDPSGDRQVLAEEHHWRAGLGGRAGRGWTAAPERVDVVGPERVQVLYRQLRKAFEEGKNEPGAADFYYGEMEMRRAAARTDRRPDRWLLFLYWATSGYALRVRRALACLALVVAATVIALTLWGFPVKGKDFKADGTLTAPTGAQPIAVTVHQSKPIRKLDDRIGKAVEITLNAVIFRAPDAELTDPGKYINLAARLLGPLFLGFSLLAIRNRVKR
ncbi:pentapeptide repeat-containing protein [Actinocorallia populi]|uniref:pentapeptide repeat-containing protein n=1 Tax=Actinocorallia populi TaxID=2079200 RepID=UPI000D7BC7D8|nr:pentapeptide repeat-containing protein [Actinocorallia populi]